MKKNVLALVVFALVIFCSTSKMQAALPCFVSQVVVNPIAENGQVADGAYMVTVTGMPTLATPCVGIAYSENGQFVTGVAYVLQKWNATTYVYEDVKSFSVQANIVNAQKRQMVIRTNLGEGSYRLVSSNENSTLELIPFSVGSRTVVQPAPQVGVQNPQDDLYLLPYGQAAAIVDSGNLYFRGNFPNLVQASGYIYQDQASQTVLVPAQFQVITTGTAFGAMRTGLFDLPWIKVITPTADFDPGLMVYGCATVTGATGNSATGCFPVFDPQSPVKQYPSTSLSSVNLR